MLLLLAWTAADLTNAALCTLDSGPLSAARNMSTSDSDGRPSQTVPPHIDDCFCCSHCVDVALHLPLFESSFEARAVVYTLPHPPLAPPLLPYHPPKA